MNELLRMIWAELSNARNLTLLLAVLAGFLAWMITQNICLLKPPPANAILNA